MNRNAKLLLVVLVVAVLVRLLFVNNYLTGDAIDTAGPARNFVETGKAFVYSVEYDKLTPFGYIKNNLYFNFSHPPMRVILYSMWASFFGFSNFTINLLPIIFGVLSIYFIYLTGKVLYNEKTGLIAACIATVLRYHVYASVIVFGDNLLMLTTISSFYFFIKYLKTQRYCFALISSVLVAAGVLTKLSAFAILPAFFFTALLYKNNIKMKRSFPVILAAIVFSVFLLYVSYPATEYITGVSNSEFNFFDSYVHTLFAAASGGENFLSAKFFYLVSFLWQLTPFFSALFLLAMIKMKRDKGYAILAFWIVSTFLIGFLSRGQDFQRYMVISIAPIIIIVSRYISDLFNKKFFNDRTLILSFILIIFLAIATGLNDMMPYYSPPTIAVFFILAAAFITLPKNRIVLLGATIGISVFFLFGTSFVVSISSSNVGPMLNELEERNYTYKELWTTREISMYLAPPHEPSLLNEIVPDKSFIKENDVKYFAYYSIYDEKKINELSELCKDAPFFVTINGKHTGLVCRMT